VSIIPAMGSQGKRIMSSRPAWATQEAPVFKNKKTKTDKKVSILFLQQYRKGNHDIK
jgi:hypothetical protein